MTVWFYTDSGGFGRGFRANFTSGVNLGSQGEQLLSERSVFMTWLHWLWFFCQQLHVQMVSSSVRQGTVSMVTVSVTVWQTVQMDTMRLTVVCNWLIGSQICEVSILYCNKLHGSQHWWLAVKSCWFRSPLIFFSGCRLLGLYISGFGCVDDSSRCFLVWLAHLKSYT